MNFATLASQFESFAQPTKTPVCVTYQEFEDWERSYVFDALKGIRYGQSFCRSFGLNDYRIFYDVDRDRCRNIIMRDWVQ